MTATRPDDPDAPADPAHLVDADARPPAASAGGSPLPVAPIRRAPTGLAADLRAVKIVCHRELLRWLTDRRRLVAGMVQPLLWLFVLGTGLSRVVEPGTQGLDFRTFLFPGVLATSVMFTAVFSGVSVVWDREFGFLREMLVAPISRTSIMAGKCLGGGIVATTQALILVALAGFAGVPYHPVMLHRAHRHPLPGLAVDHRLRTSPGGQGGQHPVGDARDPDGDHADDVPVRGPLPDRGPARLAGGGDQAQPPHLRRAAHAPRGVLPPRPVAGRGEGARPPHHVDGLAGAGGPATGRPSRPRHGSCSWSPWPASAATD